MDVRMPDGTIVQNVPEGVTQTQLSERIGRLQPASNSDRVPNNVVAPTPQAETGMVDKVIGAGEAGLSVLSAIPATLAGNVAGVVRGVTGGGYGTPQGAQDASQRAREVAGNFTYQPRTDGGREVLGALGNALDQSKLAGIGPTEAIAASAVAGPAIRQARNATGNAARAVAASPEMEGLRRGGAAAVRAVVPMPQPEVAALARTAQALDIPIRPDMLTDNRFARMIGEAFEKIPASGSRADARQVAFNRAIGSQIGADRNMVRLTQPVFNAAMQDSGGRIGDVAARTPIRLDAQTNAVLAQHAAQAERQLPGDISRIVVNYIDDLTNHSTRSVVAATGQMGDVVPGPTFRQINSQIGRQMRATSNGDLRMALSNLQDDLQNILTQNVRDPADLATLELARRQYAIGKTIEPLVAKTTVGNISPATLMQAVNRTPVQKIAMARGGGDMGDLARIGQLFLKDPMSSGTAERSLLYGGAGAVLGGTAATNPLMTAGGAASIYGAANLYNRLGPSVTRGILGAGLRD